MSTATLTTEPPDTAIAMFDVMFRTGDTGRWKKLGTATSYRDALALVNTAGNFWFRRVELQPDGPSLFDGEE